jgi:hypothetical protein
VAGGTNDVTKGSITMTMKRDTSIPGSVSLMVVGDRPGPRAFVYQPLMGGVVDSGFGPCFAELGLSVDIPGETTPSALAVTFRTTEHNEITFHIDTTQLVKAMVRSYFSQRSSDRPIAERIAPSEAELEAEIEALLPLIPLPSSDRVAIPDIGPQGRRRPRRRKP